MGWIFVVLASMVVSRTLFTFPSVKLLRMVLPMGVLVVIGLLLGNAVVGNAGLFISEESGLSKIERQTRWYLNRVIEYTNEERLDVMEERGYTRLVRFPEHLLLGAGEGANERWGTGPGPEIHSTLAGVLFYYGVPGAFFFLRFVYLIWRSLPTWWQKSLLFAPFLYSLGTYNLRNTMFWLGLAVFFVIGHAIKTSCVETRGARWLSG